MKDRVDFKKNYDGAQDSISGSLDAIKLLVGQIDALTRIANQLKSVGDSNSPDHASDDIIACAKAIENAINKLSDECEKAADHINGMMESFLK